MGFALAAALIALLVILLEEETREIFRNLSIADTRPVRDHTDSREWLESPEKFETPVGDVLVGTSVRLTEAERQRRRRRVHLRVAGLLVFALALGLSISTLESLGLSISSPESELDIVQTMTRLVLLGCAGCASLLMCAGDRKTVILYLRRFDMPSGTYRLDRVFRSRGGGRFRIAALQDEWFQSRGSTLLDTAATMALPVLLAFVFYTVYSGER
jgi:hypothetical protein